MSKALRISIGANVALAAVVAGLLWRDRPVTASSAEPVERPTMVARERGETPAASERVERRGAAAKLDPAALAQLERAGLPREIVVRAFLEDFNRRWDQRNAELEKRYAPRPVPEREYIELGRLRDIERVRELKEALGEEGYLAWDKEQMLQVVNPAGLPLTPDEAERAYRLQKEFEQQHHELQMAMEDGVADMADASTLQARAREELERELEELLGKERLERMRGITGPVAEVQWRFAELNPTANQASAVIAAEDEQRAREESLANRLAEKPEDAANLMTELKAINDAREEELRRIFGAEAYETARRQMDPTYKTLQQFASAWELKDDQVLSVHEALHSLQEEVDRTRSAAAIRQAAGQPVDWDEVESAIEQRRQQAEAGLQTLIGEERVRRLKQNGLLSNR